MVDVCDYGNNSKLYFLECNFHRQFSSAKFHFHCTKKFRWFETCHFMVFCNMRTRNWELYNRLLNFCIHLSTHGGREYSLIAIAHLHVLIFPAQGSFSLLFYCKHSKCPYIQTWKYDCTCIDTQWSHAYYTCWVCQHCIHWKFLLHMEKELFNLTTKCAPGLPSSRHFSIGYSET